MAVLWFVSGMAEDLKIRGRKIELEVKKDVRDIVDFNEVLALSGTLHVASLDTLNKVIMCRYPLCNRSP